MLLRMPVAVLLNWRGQGSRRTSLMHLKRYRGGKSREVRVVIKLHGISDFLLPDPVKYYVHRKM